MPAKSSHRKIITFTLIVIVATFPISWILYNRAKKVETEINEYQELQQSREAENALIEESEEPIDERSLMEGLIVKRLKVPVATNSQEAHIDVYWRSDFEAYLVIKNLPPIRSGERYEVFSVNGNRQKSLGVYSSPSGKTLIVKSQGALMTDDYNIRVVKN
jgi:hypothetical protein